MTNADQKIMRALAYAQKHPPMCYLCENRIGSIIGLFVPDDADEAGLPDPSGKGGYRSVIYGLCGVCQPPNKRTAMLVEEKIKEKSNEQH